MAKVNLVLGRQYENALELMSGETFLCRTEKEISSKVHPPFWRNPTELWSSFRPSVCPSVSSTARLLGHLETSSYRYMIGFSSAGAATKVF